MFRLNQFYHCKDRMAVHNEILPAYEVSLRTE